MFGQLLLRLRRILYNMAAVRLQKMDKDLREEQGPEDVKRRQLTILRQNAKRLGEPVPLQTFTEDLTAPRDASVEERRGYMAAAGTLFQIMIDRHKRAVELEEAGQVDQAIALYEENLRDEFVGADSYERLRVIYTERQDWANARRVCQAYLSLRFTNQEERQRFEGHPAQLTGEGRETAC